jgi:hypothetical protein
VSLEAEKASCETALVALQAEKDDEKSASDDALARLAAKNAELDDLVATLRAEKDLLAAQILAMQVLCMLLACCCCNHCFCYHCCCSCQR